MKKQKIRVLSDLYELPHFFGIWISDPELLAMKEKVTGGVWSPKVLLFVGDLDGFELDIYPREDDDTKFKTDFMQFQYKVDFTELTFQHHFIDENDETKYLKPIDSEWGITDDGRLNFTYEGDTRRYVPTTIDRAKLAGFDDEMMRQIIEHFVSRDHFFQETFDLNTAYRLIDEAISREEDDAGMERGALGRPDPTTWVFGGDRFPGTV